MLVICVPFPTRLRHHPDCGTTADITGTPVILDSTTTTKSCFFIVLLQLSNSAKTASYFPTHKEQPRSWAQSPSCRVNHLTLVTTYPKLIWETEWVPLRLRKALITVMIGMMRIRKMKTRVCQTGKLQCTLPEVSLKQHVSCYIIQIFATWAISGHEPMLYILFRQH